MTFGKIKLMFKIKQTKTLCLAQQGYLKTELRGNGDKLS